MDSIRPGISDQFLQAAGVETLSDGLYSLRIPYHDWTGALTQHNRWRLRVPDDGKKYHQEPDSGSHVYFAHLPLVPAAKLYLTEGEFKCLCLAEAGYQACGLPGLHCYTHDTAEPDIPPILLPGILEAVLATGCQAICFIGDSDTLTNLEYFRSAMVLAQSVPVGVKVELVQIPMGGPKGIDDIRASVNGQFPDWVSGREEEAMRVDPKKSFLLPATLRLEARGDLIHQLPPEEQNHHVERLVKMAVLAKLSKEDPLAIEQLCRTAQRVSKIPKDAFNRIVEAKIRLLKAEGDDQELTQANAKLAYYDSIQPATTERPLSDIILDARDTIKQFVITDRRYMLLAACWAAYTYAYKQSAYLPMLVICAPEEDTGKSTFLKVVGRMSYRAYVLIATATLHRVLSVYSDGTFLLDESKRMAENKDLISFVNAGFDNTSNHPVDSPIVPRWDMESGQLLEFETKFPKAFAGIGTYLERDTLSRSIVIRMERYLLTESQHVKEYIFCTDEVTGPIYQSFLKYWTEEHKAEFAVKCREVLSHFPSEIRSRNRLKYDPLLALAALSGNKSFYGEVMEAILWASDVPDTASPTLNHRLICDVAYCYYRQVLLHQMGVNDPATKKPPILFYQPKKKEYMIRKGVLVDLLLRLPEAPWKSYGRDKKALNENSLTDFLKEYGLRTEVSKFDARAQRGLLFSSFQEKYGRAARAGDPTLKSVAVELALELGPDDSPDGTPKGPSGGSPIEPSNDSPDGVSTPESPATEAPTDPLPDDLSKNHKSHKIDVCIPDRGTREDPPQNPQVGCNPVTLRCKPLSDSGLQGYTPNRNSEEGVTLQVPDNQALVAQCYRVTPYLPILEAPRVPVPLSTPAAGFCIAKHPERFVGIDTETFYPWPSEGEITAKERRRRKDGKAHTFAKDSRRNVIRLLSVHTGTEVRMFDLFTGQVPDDIRELIRSSTLIIHNSDFDVTVLRRHGFEVSSSIFDTMLAAQLLSLGEVEQQLRRRKHDPEEDLPGAEDSGDLDDDEVEEFETIFVAVSNDLGSVVEKYLGIKMEKSDTKLGASDWSVPTLSATQLEYARDDVTHFPDLMARLTAELQQANLWACFRERSEFLVHLNEVKFAGIPVDREMLRKDKEASEKLKTEKRTELRELFKDYRPLVPKSRRKNSKVKQVSNGSAVLEAPIETEEFNPNVHEQVKAALALHGILVPNVRKSTLSAIDSLETRALRLYSDSSKLLGIVKGVESSIFHDDRVRSTQWNQLVARSGRIIPRGPNVQQLPRGWREPFRVTPPQQWLKMDLAQIEIFILAIHTQCTRLIEYLSSKEGIDVYTLIAAEIFGVKPVRKNEDGCVTETLREVSKTLTLGICYCLGFRSFIARVEVATRPSFGIRGTEYSVEEAKEFFQRFFDLFPEIKLYQDKAFEDALTEDFVYTVTGQRRYLPPLLSDEDPNGYWPSRAYRRNILVNTPIQASAANQFVRAVNKFVPKLLPGVQLVHLMHDEVGLLVTPETAQPTVELVTHVFQEAFTELFGTQLEAKLESQISDSWAKIQKAKVSAST